MKFAIPAAELPGFQITPMLDVVFLLLCFFVTTSLFSQWESEMNIQLPTADSASAPDDRLPGEIIVNVAADGTATVNQRVLSAEELGERFRLLSSAFPGHPVIIRADKETRYEDVMRVLDACSKNDVWNISFATETTP